MTMPPPPPVWDAPAPAPLRPEDERTWAVLAHVIPLLGPGFLAPLVIWLVFRGRGPFLEHHAKESLNFQLTALIAMVVGSLLTVVTFGAASPVLFGIGIAWLVICILAAVAASRWEWYRYPATLRLVS
ncbi:DUF4870 domain-containing protein [Cellulomonas wangsupingiae]|uniref:DUF4870 domain-containing protein n=1 Tax=Cellulomonas wangsupingiae TaxID=2968085 RepID=UPI001D0F2048|nr:DUF4870 domain-containing protein [Cellulomonas wangsupingiae]MCM0641410.1 DUF4870 domain-containing protein [Cellulomonas wangsupingiae]